MLPETVIQLAKGRFPDHKDFEIVPLEKGGSDRRFFRVRAGAGQSMIIVSYSGQREENRHYVDIARFLGQVGVNVPTVYFHDPGQGLIFMEDLGDTDLWHFRDAEWEVRRSLYCRAIDQAVRLHSRAARELVAAPLRLEMEFDDQLYLWEQNYFFENCLGGVFGFSGAETRALAALVTLGETARDLAARSRVIVHRDFQSQNLLVDRGSVWMIDFQGMRPGIPQYDLASLVYDPYVRLTGGERAELIAHYKAGASQAGMEIRADFDEVLDRAAMQRLMQALGAYGFLGLKKNRTSFLEHIDPAKHSLTSVVSRISGLEPLHAALNSLPNQ